MCMNPIIRRLWMGCKVTSHSSREERMRWKDTSGNWCLHVCRFMCEDVKKIHFCTVLLCLARLFEWDPCIDKPTFQLRFTKLKFRLYFIAALTSNVTSMSKSLSHMTYYLPGFISEFKCQMQRFKGVFKWSPIFLKMRAILWGVSSTKGYLNQTFLNLLTNYSDMVEACCNAVTEEQTAKKVHW